MNKITQKEFANKCGITLSALANYEERGKVKMTKDRKVDENENLNILFYKRRLEIIKSKNDSGEWMSLDRKIKKVELAKKTVDTRIALIKEEKMRGEVIPTEMVKILFAQHSKNTIVEFENSLDKVLTILAKEIGMNNKTISKYRGIIKKEINIAVDSTISKTKEDIINIIEEFSEKRTRGESR